MLKEFSKVRQVENIHRKLYSDDLFDLYLWYNLAKNDFIGFQLVFSINGTRMALTAEVGKTPNIHIVETGDDLFYDPSDVLDGVGFFPKKELYKEFSERSIAIDSSIRKDILKVIESYKLDLDHKKLGLTPLL